MRNMARSRFTKDIAGHQEAEDTSKKGFIQFGLGCKFCIGDISVDWNGIGDIMMRDES